MAIHFKQTLAALSMVMVAGAASAADVQTQPEVSVGRIERWANFPSQWVDARHVDVWLPEGYSAAKRYQVLYMHDGQMLFDASKRCNQQAWDVHLSVALLVTAGRIPDTLICRYLEQR